MTTTPHLGMTLVEQSQSQKEITINEALQRIDALMNNGAIDKDLATPPGSPAAGDLYIVAGSPTGAWSGKANYLTYYDQVWRFITPREGAMVWVNDEDKLYCYSGSVWAQSAAGMSAGTYDPANIAQQVVGTTATQTLTNKTLTSPSINGGTISSITDLAVADGGTGASTAAAARTNLGVPYVIRSIISSGQTRTSTTTLSDLTSGSVSLEAGKTYRVYIVVYTSSHTAGGVKFGQSGTATYTSYRMFPTLMDSSANSHNVIGNTGSTGQIGALTNTSSGKVIIEGMVTVNAAGTFVLQFAQNASHATSSVIAAPSIMEFWEVA